MVLKVRRKPWMRKREYLKFSRHVKEIHVRLGGNSKGEKERDSEGGGESVGER
jgi:hypothetical protein